MGVRLIEQKEISNESVFEKEKVISNKYNKVKERDENGEEVEIFEYQEIEEPLTKNAVFLKSNITGESFSKKNKEKKEINEAIKNFSFE
jgi:putative cell wall-binding protein